MNGNNYYYYYLITSTAIDILNGFKKTKTTTAVFSNFEKTSDTICKNSITKKFYCRGVYGSMINLIHNYLKE